MPSSGLLTSMPRALSDVKLEETPLQAQEEGYGANLNVPGKEAFFRKLFKAVSFRRSMPNSTACQCFMLPGFLFFVVALEMIENLLN